MDVIAFSKLLIVFFVGSVTFWYVFTPYLVQPHPGIIQDVLTKTQLSGEELRSPPEKLIEVENWTKWRIFVNTSSSKTPHVIFGNSVASVPMEDVAVMNMEWRPEYTITVSRSKSKKKESSSPSSPDGPRISVIQSAPASSASSYGIYNHFVATAEKESTVKIVPRFLFGLPYDTVDEMYGTDVDQFPIVGVFTESPRFDRIIIQAYMNIVTLSVIFLLWANNPPSSISRVIKKEQ